MKFIIAICLLASATVSFAADRAIYDLMYLPKAGTFFGSTEAGYGWGKSTMHDDSGDIADLEYSAYLLQQTVGYSVVDNLFISAAMSYQNTDIDVDVTGGDTDTYKTTGESDPRFEARFRAIETEYLVDVLVGAEIATGDSETASADNDGNNKNGGNVANVAVEIGQKDLY